MSISVRRIGESPRGVSRGRRGTCGGHEHGVCPVRRRWMGEFEGGKEAEEEMKTKSPKYLVPLAKICEC